MSKHRSHGGQGEESQDAGAQAPINNERTSEPSEEDSDRCSVGGIGQATSPKTSQGC